MPSKTNSRPTKTRGHVYWVEREKAGRNHYFSVEGKTGTHNIKLSFNCTCPYGSLHPGIQCSHVISALKIFIEEHEA